MSNKIMGIELSGKNIIIAIAFMIATFVAMNIVVSLADFLTSGFIGVLVSIVVGFLLFAAYKRGR